MCTELVTMDQSKIDKNSVGLVLQKYHLQTASGDTSRQEFSLQSKIGEIDKLFGCSSVEDILDGLQKNSSEWSLQQLSSLRKMV